MKRICVNTGMLCDALQVDVTELPYEIESLTENLQLLYDVPLAYLIPGPSYLPPESIRFFYIDPNFIKAMLNGGTAIGRSTQTELQADRVILPELQAHSKSSSLHVRRAKVHANHQEKLVLVPPCNSDVRTGFLLRSSLVQRRKGIVVCGFQGKNKLAALRLETLASDIMIGIFDGELTKLTIAEPSCGLRFGCKRDLTNPVISLKEIGAPIRDEKYVLSVNDKGRVDILAAVGKIGQVLKGHKEITEDISSGVFAYELLQAAQKAELYREGEKQ